MIRASELPLETQRSLVEQGVLPTLPPAKRGSKNSEAEDLFDFQLRAHRMPRFERQYRFAKELGREWRADFAFVAERVLVEIDGGIWTQGAHGHPTDLVRNMEKRNDAVLLGWWLLAFPTRDVKGGKPIAFLQKVLARRAKPLIAPRSSDPLAYLD